jgi:hypothetical protein
MKDVAAELAKKTFTNTVYEFMLESKNKEVERTTCIEVLQWKHIVT